MPFLELALVSKTYGRGETEIRALDAVSLTISRGEFVAIMGPSGSGKSTMMNILGCLDTPTSGHYRFEGVDVGALSQNERASLRRYYLGFVFQGFNLLHRTSALENVELPLVYRGTRARERRRLAWDALQAVGLDGREHHTPGELSGGQMQRVAIARAIVTNPSLLFADEPTGNLDTVRSVDIMRLIVSLNRERGLTVVMVTHEPEMAAYASRVIHCRDGHIERDESTLERAS
jgi:ABC-type lipoprotein export system ATPase subunit